MVSLFIKDHGSKEELQRNLDSYKRLLELEKRSRFQNDKLKKLKRKLIDAGINPNA